VKDDNDTRRPRSTAATLLPADRPTDLQHSFSMKKRSEETQTLRAGCSKAEPKIFAPPQTPFPRGRGTAKIESAGDGHFYLQSQFGEDRCTQFRVIVVTNPPPHTQTHKQTGPITIHCAAASAQCNKGENGTRHKAKLQVYWRNTYIKHMQRNETDGIVLHRAEAVKWEVLISVLTVFC